MIRIAVVALALAFAGPAISKPNAQLVRSVEHRLALWGFGQVDGTALSTAQVSALHLKLTNAPSRFGGRAFIFKQELKTILGWDGSERSHSLKKSD